LPLQALPRVATCSTTAAAVGSTAVTRSPRTPLPAADAEEDEAKILVQHF